MTFHLACMTALFSQHCFASCASLAEPVHGSKRLDSLDSQRLPAGRAAAKPVLLKSGECELSHSVYAQKHMLHDRFPMAVEAVAKSLRSSSSMVCTMGSPLQIAFDLDLAARLCAFSSYVSWAWEVSPVPAQMQSTTLRSLQVVPSLWEEKIS